MKIYKKKLREYFIKPPSESQLLEKCTEQDLILSKEEKSGKISVSEVVIPSKFMNSRQS